MRLGQLARKLDISPTQIINFLTENGIQISEGSNVKLDSQQEEEIIRKFGNNLLEIPFESNELETVLDETIEENESGTSTNEPGQQETHDQPQLSEENADSENSETPEVPKVQEEEMELIKAPKVTLPGLKVVGRIDLPEPKETQEEIPEESEEPADSKKVEIHKEDSTPSIDHPRQRGRNKRRSEKQQINPVEAKRLREEKENARQKKIQERRNKDQRRLRYQEQQRKIRVEFIPKTKTIEAIDEQDEEVVEEPIIRRNWLSRLWHMLDADK